MNLTQLAEQENLELEAGINIEEVQSVLNGFQNNKTPGDDGFTKEFYEAFFDLIGSALLDSLKFFCQNSQDGYEAKYVANERSNFVLSDNASYVPRHIQDSLCGLHAQCS